MRNLLLFNAGERDASTGSRGVTVPKKRGYRERERRKNGTEVVFDSLDLDEIIQGLFNGHDDSSYLSINCANVEVQLECALAVGRRSKPTNRSVSVSARLETSPRTCLPARVLEGVKKECQSPWGWVWTEEGERVSINCMYRKWKELETFY